ncbi:uncharacterized protein LOC144658325 isoform X2 [Oculina patagonica]
MGCAFSSNRVRVPRILKKRKVSRSQKYRVSRSPSPPPKIEFNLTRDFNYQKPSERVSTPNGSSAELQMYEPDIAPSLLAWLMGPKDCLEDYVPELANAKKNKETTANQQRKKDRDFVLPDCLSYNGYHEYGYHLFTLNSSVFNSTIRDMSFEFGEQLLRVIIYQPSWFFQIVLDEQTDGTGFFSAAVTKKLRITSNFKELAKLTGFPGEIKSTY